MALMYSIMIRARKGDNIMKIFGYRYYIKIIKILKYSQCEKNPHILSRKFHSSYRKSGNSETCNAMFVFLPYSYAEQEILIFFVPCIWF